MNGRKELSILPRYFVNSDLFVVNYIFKNSLFTSSLYYNEILIWFWVIICKKKNQSKSSVVMLWVN